MTVHQAALPLVRLRNSEIYFTSAKCPEVMFKCEALLALVTHT